MLATMPPPEDDEYLQYLYVEHPKIYLNVIVRVGQYLEEMGCEEKARGK